MIRTYDDLLNMLDDQLMAERTFDWNEFYKDRNKKIPFFINAPDENLVSYFQQKMIQPQKVLELGCGPGRNALYLAQQGCDVDAVDRSTEGLKWGEERSKEMGLDVQFRNEDIFNLDVEKASYDLVYDSGCFHHIAPHRRMNYLELLNKSLKPGGHFALTCFVENGPLGGSSMEDWEVYEQRSLQGGLGFTPEKLQTIFQDFEVIEIREMNAFEGEDLFGVEGLLTALFRKV
ncbi:class I SAM-dependent methyltransferase [Thalassobacillus hwangdonensis]|uniref:Class I SAM-dependent methyltransferase n=1 Tax=Thalassobacillus hwangdonensis TaxID=546108 RepID=A0ABW3L6F6_9BACI